MIYKLMVSSGAVLLAAVLAIGGYAGWIAASRPHPTVDYLERINEPVRAIPEEARAWPVLREALLSFQPRPEELPHNASPRPGDDLWPVAMDWVHANQELLPLLREAASRESYGLIYDNTLAHEYMQELYTRRGELDRVAAVAAAAVDPDVPTTVMTMVC